MFCDLIVILNKDITKNIYYYQDMEIILLTGRAGKFRKLQFGLGIQLGALLLFVIMLSGAGYFFGVNSADAGAIPDSNTIAHTKKEIDELKLVLVDLQQQRDQLAMANIGVQADAELLTQKVGEMNAQIIRLNAFGDRLANLAKIDKEEFAFNADPAQGGILQELKLPQGNIQQAQDFSASVDALQLKLNGKQEQLDYLERFFLREKVDNKTALSVRPIKKGWISSFFGKRKDPFTGKQAYHSGIDMAGKRGSAIIAAADGIVTWSGKRWAYGQMVEIDHGKGIITRYGHNEALTVKVGEHVKRGELIAKMGSSGRSTGPHLHFEVRKNGKAVNPLKYIR